MVDQSKVILIVTGEYWEREIRHAVYLLLKRVSDERDR